MGLREIECNRVLPVNEVTEIESALTDSGVRVKVTFANRMHWTLHLTDSQALSWMGSMAGCLTDRIKTQAPSERSPHQTAAPIGGA